MAAAVRKVPSLNRHMPQNGEEREYSKSAKRNSAQTISREPRLWEKRFVRRKIKMKKILALILALAMTFALAACGGSNAGNTDGDAQTPAGKTFTVVVTDLEGNETKFEYTSDAATVGDALLAEGLIQGDVGEYGLYINTVNGITADWDKDQTYWAFYIDGEYAMTGVDATEITEGAVYGLTLTKG